MSFLGSLFGSSAGAAGGSTAQKGGEPGPDVQARHAATKVHAFRGKYGRVFCMSPSAVHHVDPDTMRITNSWPWADVADFAPTISTTTDFTFTVREGASKKTEVLKFVTEQRSALLCDLARFSVGGGERDPSAKRFVAVKITRASQRAEVALELGSWYIAVLAQDGARKSLYSFKEVTAVRPLREDPSALAVYVHGRARLFALPERSEFMRLLGLALARLALLPVLVEAPMATAEQRAERLAHGNDATAPRLGEYDVLKVTPRHAAPRPRKLVLTETSFTERDASTYAVVSSRPLRSVFNIVRHWDDPTRLSIEYRDGSTRVYLTSLRDALLGSLLDAARNQGNEHVGVSAEATRPGDRACLLSMDEEPVGEAAYLAALGRVPKAQPGAPYSAALVRAAGEFNANVSPMGLPYAAKRAPVLAALSEVVSAALAAASMADMPTAITITLLNALARLVASKEGYKACITHPEATPLVARTLAHEDPGVAYAAFELLRRLLRNPRRGDADEDVEASARKLLLTPEVRVLIIQALDTHSGGGGGGGGGEKGAAAAAAAAAGGAKKSERGASTSAGNEGTLVVMSIILCLDTLLVSHVDTTSSEAWEHLMQLTASRYSALLGLFRCRCSGVVESATLLMRAIVEQADLATCRAMQNAALSSGVWLRHFFNSAYAVSPDQRYVSRYLVELWSTGNSTAREVLRHMLPAGLLLYLDMPKLKSDEAAHMNAVEAAGSATSAPQSAAAATAELAAATAAMNRGLAGRLRTRIEQAERSAQSRQKRRIAALDEASAGAKRGFFGQKLVDVEAERARSAAAAAAVSAAAAMTKAKIEGDSGKEDNYTVMFFQVMQDHMMPDLIWNQQTRGELRASLEAELREIEREIELGGAVTGSQVTGAGSRVASAVAAAVAPAAPAPAAPAPVAAAAGAAPVSAAAADAKAAAGSGGSEEGGAKAPAPAATVVHTVTGGVDLNLRVAWNYSEFEVEYPSLVQELRVGDYYLRLFLEAGDASVATLREPARFFDALYRRVLRETAPNLKCMCLRGMTRVYEKHSRAIGAFDDTDYMVYLMSQTQHAEVRDRLLLLLSALSVHPMNCEKMINPDCMELLVDLLTTAHTTDNEMRAMPSLKAAGGAALLLTDSAPGSAAARSAFGGAAAAAAHDATKEDDGTPAGVTEASAVNGNPKESLKIWHYRARKSDLAAGEKPEKGPYSLQDIQRLSDMKKLAGDSLVWAVGMREWVRLDSLRAILWYCCSEGLPALTPTARGEAACELLRALVRLRPAVDGEGAPVRPVPRAKRVLCGSRTLPHLAQALLAGSPKLVDGVAALLTELCTHNPKAMVKLYTTGIFFFTLGYAGSNWNSLSGLLYLTHLSQSFHSDAASLASETSLAKRSILGTLLPESLLCVLENRGPAHFGEAFLSNLDTPEVIWKYSMRSHLLDMMVQHIGDLPARLSANPCTLYDYCPVPPVKYEELETELWCHNFYLANLCDEARFPGWAIPDPVALLRGVLDGWRKEVSKTGSKGVPLDEAYVTMGLAAGADDKEIRKAYRKLALKFHPDKNPQGREVFEKIQKAFETLTDSRQAGSSSGMGGGPDPVSILLMVRTQNILFARHASVLRAYKYAGYPLVLGALGGLKEETNLGGERAPFVDALTRLVYLTCLASTKNAEELVREGGCEALAWLLSKTVPLALGAGTGAMLPGVHPVMRITDNALHTLSGLATIREARDRMEKLPALPTHIVSCLTLVTAAKVMQHSLEAMARLAIAPVFQDALVACGALYRLFPLLFRYDATFEERDAAAAAAGKSLPGASEGETSGSTGGSVHTENEQRAANLHAKLAVRTLARLGGYLEGDLASPRNHLVRRCAAALLTPPLAKRLARPSSDPLLRILNGSEESSTVIWTPGMRKELITFLGAALEHLSRSGGVADMAPAAAMRYSALKEELRLAGIYVRLYVAEPGVALEDPYALVVGLLQHVAFSRVGGAAPIPPAVAEKALAAADEEGPVYPYEAQAPDTARRHLRMALRALHLVLVNCTGTEGAVAKEAAVYLRPLFSLFDREDSGAVAGGDGDDLSGAGSHSGGGSQLGGTVSTNKSAAGSGASAGAGGARSTPAPPTASLRELTLTAIAAFAPNEACAATVAELHLIPCLVRHLPRDSASFGPILRTLFAHSGIIAEVARVGILLDLALVFVGGAASGPAPKPGAVKGHAVAPAHPKPVRATAGALLSLMTSDGHLGPSLLMNLQQLMPEALAMAVKESVSGAAGGGSGSSLLASAGSGGGAAGAGGGTGSQGDVVSAFDAEHETPELIWNATCRHELRSALGDLVTGLNGLRSRAGAANAPGGADGCGWTLPATFRVRFSTCEGELRCGGVYVRIFLKEPTFPLRDPKGFLEALLRRFVSESEHLCGMTSDDANRVREAQAAAAEAAKAEEAAGGVGLRTRGAAEGGEGSLVVRGEDVLTQLTHGIVCLLRVRSVLCEAVGQLGYIPKLAGVLSQSVGKPARYNLGIQCVRVLQVLAATRSSVPALAKGNIVPAMLRALTPPLPRDAAFFLETLKLMLETDAAQDPLASPHDLIRAAIAGEAIPLMMNILEKENLDALVDASAAKVHAVNIIKVLESDAVHGAMAQGALSASHAQTWDKYRHQKHDLFLSRNDTRDYFLADVATAAPAFMLKNTSEWSEGQAGGGGGGSAAPPPSMPSYSGGATAAAGSMSPGGSSDYSAPPPAPDSLPQRAFNLPGFQAPAPQAAADPFAAPNAAAGSSADIDLLGL